MVKIKNMIIYFNIFIELRLKRKYHRSCIFKYIIGKGIFKNLYGSNKYITLETLQLKIFWDRIEVIRQNNTWLSIRKQFR